MCIKFYNKNAITIQSVYRAYYCRRYVFDYYAMKKWIKKVNKKNQELIRDIKDQHQFRRIEIVNEVVMIFIFSLKTNECFYASH